LFTFFVCYVHIYIKLNLSLIGVTVAPGIYPPTPTGQLISSITSYALIAGVALLLLGGSIFSALGVPEPAFYKTMKDNQAMTIVALFMLNNLGNSFLATGAFEIFVDGMCTYLHRRAYHTHIPYNGLMLNCVRWAIIPGELVFSRIQSKRFPSAVDITEFMSQIVSK
jgi:hypothetical protein